MAQEDVTTAATEGVVSPSVSVVEELGRKAAEAEARLREKEEENAALKRQIESYHVRWLEHEIRAKALEEAFHEQVAALQVRPCVRQSLDSRTRSGSIT
jgi:hypothetical protein